MNAPDPTTLQTSEPTFWEELFAFLSADSLDQMLSWEFWVIVTIVLLVGEILTAGFLLGALTPGTVLAAVAAAIGFGMNIQLMAFVVGTLVGLIYLRPLFMRKMVDGGVPSNTDALIRATAEVTESISGTATGRVKVVSEEWRARASREFPVGSQVQILSVEGNTLIVGPAE